ncbi:MAG: response regulator transcription factor [Gammaproteobacteria bacterium]|nr:response regulator transcription factor [Gammaproteobacteria bacterium]
MPVRVILADDHEIVRAGLRRLIDASPDIQVLVEVENGEQAFREYFAQQPDVALFDLNMPGMGGLEAIRRILARDANARILALSMHEDAVYPARALQSGAKGYVTKRCAPDVLLDAIRTVARGEVFLEPRIARQLALDGLNGKEEPLMALTAREFEVFRLLAAGKSVNEIAETLFLSAKTVGTYQTRILTKLNANNLSDLTRLAIRMGYIEA